MKSSLSVYLSSAISLITIALLATSHVASAGNDLPKIEIEKIDEGIYLHTSYKEFTGFGLVASNGLVVVDNKNAYIVDTPSSEIDTKDLVKWFTSRNFSVKGSVSTHFHEDSTAGVKWLNSESIPTYASTLTNRLLKKAGREQTSKTFSETTHWLVKDLIEVYYPGPGHSEDNVVVWMPKQQVLFGGCFVKSKSLGNLGDAVLEHWPNSADKLIAKYGQAKTVVPGHGKIGQASLLKKTKDLAHNKLHNH